jgi:hypothetical protein
MTQLTVRDTRLDKHTGLKVTDHQGFLNSAISNRPPNPAGSLRTS